MGLKIRSSIWEVIPKRGISQHFLSFLRKLCILLKTSAIFPQKSEVLNKIKKKSI